MRLLLGTALAALVLAAVGCGEEQDSRSPNPAQARQSCQPETDLNVTYDNDGSGYPSAEEAAAGYAEGGSLEVVNESKDSAQFESLDGAGQALAVIDVVRLPGSGEWVATSVQTCFR